MSIPSVGTAVNLPHDDFAARISRPVTGFVQTARNRT